MLTPLKLFAPLSIVMKCEHDASSQDQVGID